MNFEQLRRRVEKVEALTERRRELMHAHRARLNAEWRATWTPGRIVIAGLITGFLSGRANTGAAVRKLGRLGAVGGPKILQLVSSLTTMMTSLQAVVAATTAKQAAETAEQAATTADVAAGTAGDAVPAAGGPAATAAAAAAGAAAAREQVAAATGAPDIAGDVPPATDPRPVSDRPRRAEPSIDAATPPRAAEAATDVSER